MRRSHFSFVNLTLLESPKVKVESQEQLKQFGEFIRPDEEEGNFGSDVYALNNSTNEDLRQSWRVFTAMKNAEGVARNKARRLENAAWRIQGIRKLGKSPTFNGGLPEPVDFSSSSFNSFTRSNLKDFVNKWSLPEDCVKDLLQYLTDKHFDRDGLFPSSDSDDLLGALTEDLPQRLKSERPKLYAVFSHSLERNGANNFCHFLLKSLVTTTNHRYILLAPKEGPMRGDFEQLGMEVCLIDPNTEGFLETFESIVIAKGISAMLANTIMRCDVILKAYRMRLPTVWVIHESWPQDKLDYYAKEVFMRKNLGADMIKEAFRVCNCIVFPSNMQRGLYKGLYRERTARTIYNGIPLGSLDEFRKTKNRQQIREALGYGPDDFLVLHLGTICGRKGQIYTAQACTNLIKRAGLKNLKVLMVGARYIRDHEVAYIDRIKETVSESGLSWARFEDAQKEGPGALGKAEVTLMDIQKNVLRFYMAADIVLVPSLNEVLPLVICEAMAFEKPVICSRIDAIPEAVADGVEGLLIPPGDVSALQGAISKLYHDPKLRKQLGAAGRQRVLTQFSYTHMCTLYRSLIQSGWKNATPPTSPVPQESKSLNLPPMCPSSSSNTGKGVNQSSVNNLSGLTVLVDMDNTLVDWDAEFIDRFNKHPTLAKKLMSSTEPVKDVQRIVRNRKFFEIENNFPPNMKKEILEVIAEQGFFSSLKPFPGAISAMQDMVKAGINVRLVTSPHPTCPGPCAMEKYNFVAKNLGHGWIERVIIARDKTPIQGDFIIDDKPKIKGVNKKPSWKHIHFDQPYNRFLQENVAPKRLAEWSNWRDLFAAGKLI
jgi:glycosyltransferase involved in cell wall biosynthesis/5'(3')-deoxyribonucleotidase